MASQTGTETVETKEYVVANVVVSEDEYKEYEADLVSWLEDREYEDWCYRWDAE